MVGACLLTLNQFRIKDWFSVEDVVGGKRKKKEVNDLVAGSAKVTGYNLTQLSIDCHGKKGERKDLKAVEALVNAAYEDNDDEWEADYAKLELVNETLKDQLKSAKEKCVKLEADCKHWNAM